MLRTYKSCFECELREAKNIHATVQNEAKNVIRSTFF